MVGGYFGLIGSGTAQKSAGHLDLHLQGLPASHVGQHVGWSIRTDSTFAVSVIDEASDLTLSLPPDLRSSPVVVAVIIIIIGTGCLYSFYTLTFLLNTNQFQ